LQQPETYYPANADSLLAAQNARDGIVMRALEALPFPLETTVTVSVPIIGSFEVTATVTKEIVQGIYQDIAAYLDATKYTMAKIDSTWKAVVMFILVILALPFVGIKLLIQTIKRMF